MRKPSQKPRVGRWPLIAGLLVALPWTVARAQDQPATNQPQQPIPPEQAGGQEGAPVQGEETVPPLRGPQNDVTPVSGVEDYRLGGLNLGRSFIIGQVQFNEIYDTNTNSSQSGSTATSDSISNLHGSMALQWLGARNAFALDYITGVAFFARGTNSIGTIQQFNVTEKFYTRRWTLLMGDDFAYLPQSALGLSGLGYGPTGNPGLPGLGGGINNYNPFYLPGISIQSLGNRLSNAIVGQAQYTFGARSSADFSATYGQIHFLNAGFLNSSNIGLSGGYDFAFTPRQTLNLSYDANLISFASGQPGFSSQSPRVGYRRQITGRMELLVSAGPTFSHFPNPVAGSGTRLGWSARSVLRYLTVRNNYSLIYGHHITEGSGLLIGAETDMVDGGVARILSRNWTASVHGIFNHNHTLRQTTGNVADRHFNSWVADFSLQRRLGQTAHLELRYAIMRQTADTSVCLMNISCGNVALRNQFGLGLSWDSQPHSLE